MNPLGNLLTKKKYPLNLFLSEYNISFSTHISEHSAWAYTNIYSVAYPSNVRVDDIPRFFHGIQHVNRVALYVLSFANLYRKYGNVDALSLNDDDIKLLQIAALFHDSARENEGQDLWDCDSALLCYYYLTKVLGLAAEKAKLFAEAIANKDYMPERTYHSLSNVDLEPSWQSSVSSFPKNIYQKIIHDSDCLDIIRARDHFEQSYLDLYQDYVKNSEIVPDKPQRAEIVSFEIAKLYQNASSLIELGGDSRRRTRSSVKKMFECEKGYSLMMSKLCPKKHSLLYHLSIHGLLSEGAFDVSEDMNVSSDPILASIEKSEAFYRGVFMPSMFRNSKKDPETLADLEVRKVLRKTGVPTRSKKENNINKNGNPNRSTSLLGLNGGVYSSAGFITIT